MSLDGMHAYVAAEIDDAVAVFTRDPSDGTLTWVEAEIDGVNGVDGLDSARIVTVSSDGENVYVASLFDNAIAVFSRDQLTGELTFLQAVKDTPQVDIGLEGARSVAVTDDGRHVYGVSNQDDAIAAFSRITNSPPLIESQVFN